MLRKTIFSLSSLFMLGASINACATASDEDIAESDGAATVDAVCKQVATYPNAPLAQYVTAKGGKLAGPNLAEVANFTAWPAYQPSGFTGKYDPNIVKARTSAADALTNIAARFSGCENNIQNHIKTKKPNVYVYFTGYGGETQNNSVIDEGAILRWINQRDPNALIFSINWSCSNSHDGFCASNADKLKLTSASPALKRLTDTVNAAMPAAKPAVDQILAQTAQNQKGYDSALSHAMQLGALLVDQLLVLDSATPIGDINFIGYSMGAHAASQVLIQDFVGDNSGFKWTRAGQCDDGKDACTVAHLSKVKWSLSLGLSGWSEALRTQNKFDPQGRSGRDATDAAQNFNGGLIRISDPRFNGKNTVFNRRMDPTGNSDDTLQRGFNDVFFKDYNHNSHDYALPSFINPAFLSALDAFLATPGTKAKTVQGIGAVFDNAGMVDFDDCPATGTCEAPTGYLAHASNRSHQRLKILKTDAVATTDGVRHPERNVNRAVRFASGSKPVVLDTFEQEDLRGGAELYYRPQYDVGAAGTHGILSYGGCGGNANDLMPEAYVKDGNLVFSMSYGGQRYSASAPLSATKLKRGAWTHLAFGWDLPVVSIADPSRPDFQANVAKYGPALVLAAGLTKPSPSTFQRQQGQGKLMIYANGKLVASSPLGSAASQRDCLASADVVGTRQYDADGETYPPFSPYASYDNSAASNSVQMGLGTLCKAYRVRNEQAFFGCAQSSSGVNADADMDDITLIWGPGRTKFDDVGEGGAPKLWPIGSSYGSK